MTPDHRIVFLFSGQGSHYRGMGENLYKGHPVFAQALDSSDSLVQKRIGRSLVEELYSNTSASFDNLHITHPAIVSIELALWSELSAAGIHADYVFGSSLGEFAAAAACGVWSPESAVDAAVIQALTITENNDPGGMLAVLEIGPAALAQLTHDHDLYIASSNFPGHYTLSGTTSCLDAAEKTLKSAATPYLRLPVSYPFHCPLLAKGKDLFINYMRTITPLKAPRVAFVSGLHSHLLSDLPEHYFWDVISQPANFADAISVLEGRCPCLYVDLGPSGTAATFVSYILPASSRSIVHRIMTPFRQDEKQLAGLFKLLENQRARNHEPCT